MLTRSSYRLLVLLMLSAASLLALSGCSLVRGDEARVSFSVQPQVLRAEHLRLQVTDGRSTWRLDGGDFSRAGGEPAGGGRTRELRTASSGTLAVDFALVPSPADTVAAGRVELPLRSDWRWGVDFMVAESDPRRMCFGCVGSRPFPLPSAYRRTPADSLWVVWGGNSIKDPAIY